MLRRDDTTQIPPKRTKPNKVSRTRFPKQVSKNQFTNKDNNNLVSKQLPKICSANDVPLRTKTKFLQTFPNKKTASANSLRNKFPNNACANKSTMTCREKQIISQCGRQNNVPHKSPFKKFTSEVRNFCRNAATREQMPKQISKTHFQKQIYKNKFPKTSLPKQPISKNSFQK